MNGDAVPMVWQAEPAECGLACLAMLLAAAGGEADLPALRRRHGPVPQGLSLADLVRLARAEGLGARAVRLEPEDLPRLALPAVLHWDLDHFVVLVALEGERCRIHDPAAGPRTVSRRSLARHFTGVAMEAWPQAVPGAAAAPAHPARTMGGLLRRLRAWAAPAETPWVQAPLAAVVLALEVLWLAWPALLPWAIDDGLSARHGPAAADAATGWPDGPALASLLALWFCLSIGGLGFLRDRLLQQRGAAWALRLRCGWPAAAGELGPPAASGEDRLADARATLAAWAERWLLRGRHLRLPAAVGVAGGLAALALLAAVQPAMAVTAAVVLGLAAGLRLLLEHPARAAEAAWQRAVERTRRQQRDTTRALAQWQRLNRLPDREAEAQALLAVELQAQLRAGRWRRCLSALRAAVTVAGLLALAWVAAAGLADAGADPRAALSPGTALAALAWGAHSLRRGWAALERALELAAPAGTAGAAWAEAMAPARPQGTLQATAAADADPPGLAAEADRRPGRHPDAAMAPPVDAGGPGDVDAGADVDADAWRDRDPDAGGPASRRSAARSGDGSSDRSAIRSGPAPTVLHGSAAAAGRPAPVSPGPAFAPTLTEPLPAADVDGRSRTGSRQPPALALKALRFRYASTAPWVIDRLALVIPPGQAIGIVGPTGCGKTTLARLLLGLLPPQQGRLLIDGRPLAEPAVRAAWAARVAGVLQDDALLPGTLADNIAGFSARPDRERIEASARRAAIDDVVDALPMGYDTVVDGAGQLLSAGQRQALLLARALYRRPQVLVIDAALDGLDPRRRAAVSATLSRLKATRILIGERDRMPPWVERVVELDAGQVQRDLPLRMRPGEARPPFPSRPLAPG